MSRALNIDATRDQVVAACTKLKVEISTIEVLPGGCTRVVMRNGDGAAIVRRHFGKNVLLTPQARTPLALASRNNTAFSPSVARS